MIIMAKSTGGNVEGFLMKVIFISNYFNHHQKWLAKELSTKCQYRFVATSKMSVERKLLGYGEMEIPQYVVDYELAPNLKAQIESCDVVIAGSAPEGINRKRIRSGKLLFRYSERPFKKKDSLLKIMPRYIKWNLQNPKRAPIYILCASGFTAYDYAKVGLFRNRTYKWGYFPETKKYNIEMLLARKKKQRILWCGRFLSWKHPDDALRVAEMLKKAGYSFQIDFIGNGAMGEQLEQMVVEFDLLDRVNLLGAVSHEQVREHMEVSEIYLFTSDRQEGWGAVLNEAMNSGCAVVASHAIGAVPYLIKDGINGLVYRFGDTDMLYEKVKYLLDNPEEQKRLGQAAYQTITETWSAEVAAERFVKLAQHILDGEKFPDLYEDGPCSKAEIIKDDWFP